MSVSDVSQKAIANLGWNDIRLTAPVFVGDTIYAESEVLAKRESAKRPTQGIVTVRTPGRKADGTVFMTFERTVLVPKRGHGVDDERGNPRRSSTLPVAASYLLPRQASRQAAAFVGS